LVNQPRCCFHTPWPRSFPRSWKVWSLKIRCNFLPDMRHCWYFVLLRTPNLIFSMNFRNPWGLSVFLDLVVDHVCVLEWTLPSLKFVSSSITLSTDTSKILSDSEWSRESHWTQKMDNAAFSKTSIITFSYVTEFLYQVETSGGWKFCPTNACKDAKEQVSYYSWGTVTSLL